MVDDGVTHTKCMHLRSDYNLCTHSQLCSSIGNDMIPMDGLKKIIALLVYSVPVQCTLCRQLHTTLYK